MPRPLPATRYFPAVQAGAVPPTATAPSGAPPWPAATAPLAVVALTLAKALGGRGITVNAVAPGIVDTDINASCLRGNEAAERSAAALSVLGRVGRPEDVADVVAFLASDGGRWVTGQVVDATGGSHL